MKEKSKARRIKQKDTREESNRGITLIALVVTIIVLIILAVVTINLVFSENGLIKQAEKSKDHQANAVASDEGALEAYDAKIGEYLPFDPSRITIGKATRVKDYGKKVVDYKVSDEVDKETDGFRLFYQDSKYTYLISDRLVEIGRDRSGSSSYIKIVMKMVQM